MTVADPYPKPNFDHLVRSTDRRGTVEFAVPPHSTPQSGYCTDIAAWVLVVATRELGPDPTLNGLAGVSLRFLAEAQTLTGSCRNRMDRSGGWLDEPSVGDWWGRCLWGLGTAIAHSNVAWARLSAVNQFERAAQQRSPWTKATAFATVGAAEVLAKDPAHAGARALVTDYVAALAPASTDPRWPWPEPRLTAANAILAEAMIAAGVALDDSPLRVRGLELLAWLLDRESREGHLSPPSAAGRGPGDAPPDFDQQPVEVAMLADACARAAVVDDDPLWRSGVRMAAAWFLGDNDVGEPMWDPATGGGYDGLTSTGADSRQGTESTLAVISTLQQAQRLSTVL